MQKQYYEVILRANIPVYDVYKSGNVVARLEPGEQVLDYFNWYIDKGIVKVTTTQSGNKKLVLPVQGGPNKGYFVIHVLVDWIERVRDYILMDSCDITPIPRFTVIKYSLLTPRLATENRTAVARRYRRQSFSRRKK